MIASIFYNENKNCEHNALTLRDFRRVTELDFLNKPSVSAYFERCWQAFTKNLMQIQAEDLCIKEV